MTDTDDLRRLAEVATPGPWEHRENGWLYTRIADDPNWCIGKAYHMPEGEASYGTPQMDNNAAYIAAVNPQAVVSLIDRYEAQIAALESLLDEAETYVEYVADGEAGSAEGQSARELQARILAALNGPADLRDMVMVPVEPTDEILDAMDDGFPQFCEGDIRLHHLADAWRRAMIAARSK